MNINSILRVTGNIFIYFVAIGLTSSSFAKLLGEKSVVKALNLINLTNPITVGCLEFLCALLLALPKTRKIGVLMCTAYLGGVIVAENALNGKPIGGILLSILLWLGIALRDPKWLGIDLNISKNTNE